MTTELNLIGDAVIDGAAPVPCELRFIRETVDVSTRSPEADPSWSMADANGHYHAASFDGRVVTYPTLATRTRPCDGACGDPDHLESYYVCAICEVEVRPGTIPGPHHRTIPGRSSWECVVDAGVPFGQTVTIRLVHDDHEWFGLARPTGEVTMSSAGPVRTRLFGVGPLGNRSRKRKAAA